MLQKLKTRVSGKLTYALFLCAISASNTYSQAGQISISKDDMSRLISSSTEKIEIYKVDKKNINVYSDPNEVERLEKLDYAYEQRQENNQREDPINAYYQSIEYRKTKNEAISEISTKIDEYLASKEKYKKKSHILNEAQILADKYNISISIYEFEKVPKGYLSVKRNRMLRLYDDVNRVDDKDIQRYKYELTSHKLSEPIKPNELLRKEKLKELKSNTIDREAYILTDELINPLEFSGTFKFIDEKYLMCRLTSYKFVINELVDIPVTGCLYAKKYPILQDQNTNELYYVVKESFVKRINGFKEYDMLKQEISKYGYAVNEKGQIKTKMATISFGEWVVLKLKENPNYLKQLDADYSKIAELQKTLPAYSKTLDRFIGLYRVQRRMSTSDIDSWRASTKKADNIFRQIYKLKDKYGDRVWEISSSIDKSKIYDDFMDNLTVSSNILGV